MFVVADVPTTLKLLEHYGLCLNFIKNHKGKLNRNWNKWKCAKIDKKVDSGKSFQGGNKKGIKWHDWLNKNNQGIDVTEK